MKSTLRFLLYLLSWTHLLQMTQAGGGEIESCAVQSQKNAPQALPTTTTSSTPTKATTTTETLICQIRTLHSSLNLLTLTPAPADTIIKLKLICNDLLFFESTLSSPQQLTPFKNLRELQITNCKLKSIENLGNLPLLEKLIINTGNSDWPQRTLNLSPGALNNSTRNLQILQLGFNNILSLPPSFLCELGNLHTLNLTHNLLSNINDLGLSSSSTSTCLTGESSTKLKSLDLSFNSLQTLDKFESVYLTQVEILRLDHNRLSELLPGALAPFTQLRLLNLSSNHLISLASHLLTASAHLRELYLRNNSLTALPPGLFQKLEHLRVLDISENSLQGSWISSNVFSKLYRLLHLNLSRNQLTHFGPSTFSDLFTLQSLDLSHNLISTLVDSPFQALSTLISLNLAHNRLTTLSAVTFKGLISLQKLSLDYNEISAVDSGAFENSTEIQDLSVVRNQLEEIPAGILKLKKLRSLDLGENRIGQLENTTLVGLEQLYGLRLAGNLISEVPRGFCVNTPKLRALNLAANKIQKIVTPSFGACPELRVLRLDSNELRVWAANLKLELGSLLWLNISTNLLDSLDYSSFPRTLEWLDVSHNLVGDLKDDFRRATLPHLRVLDLSWNNLTGLDGTSVPGGLEVIKLGYNRIDTVGADTFGGVGRLRRVELQGNQLRKLDLKALRLPLAGEYVSKSPQVEFFLAGNPFLCDCDMEWLTRVNQLSSFRSMSVVDMDDIQCELSFWRGAEPNARSLGEMRPQDFLCGYTSHCFALCHCCEFDYCDCQMTCPEGCECFHDDTWSANVVNCAGRGVSAVPSALPMDSTQVYLDGNNIGQLKSHGFIGRKNLRSLYLNSSAIEKISNKSFNGLHSLQVLHLQENKLTELVGFEFEGLTRLQELFLQKNFIRSISNDTFLNLKSLEILNLAGNLLFTFKVWQLSLNRNLGEVYLAGNQFECGHCEFLGLLHKWTRENTRKIQDLQGMRCVWNNTGKLGPLIRDYNDTCTTSGVFQIFDLSAPNSLYVLLGAAVFIVITIAILVLVYAEKLRSVLLKCLQLKEPPPRGASFDATFIFSRNDTDFVKRLADTLQAKGYRILLAPDPKRALESHNTLMVTVISKNFLQEFNTEPDFRQVIFNVLLWGNNYSSDNNNLNCVIVVKDKIPKEKTREFFNSFESKRRKVLEQRTVVFESKKKFWDKFTSYLGPPRHSPLDEAPGNNIYNNSDTGYGTSPCSSLVYKSNFHSALETNSLNSIPAIKNPMENKWCGGRIPQPPPHFQEMLRNSQFSLNSGPGLGPIYNHNNSTGGRGSRNTNSVSSHSNASPPSNATDTTTVDLETREDEPSINEYYSHYYHEPGALDLQPATHPPSNLHTSDDHYYFSLEPAASPPNNFKEGTLQFPPHPNARIQMQTFMV